MPILVTVLLCIAAAAIAIARVLRGELAGNQTV